MAKRSRMGERNTYNCLKRLLDAGLIEDVAAEDAPADSKKYSSAVRKVTPKSQWRSVEQGPAISAPLHASSPNPSSTTDIGSKDLEELRSSGLTFAPSGRAGRRARSQPELEDDPQSHVMAELEAEGERPRRVKETLADPTKPRYRTKRITGSGNLARLFGVLGKEVGHPVPGLTNETALRGTIQRWLNDGAEYANIRTMIETYWSDTFQRSETKPAWQDFIGARGALAAQATKVSGLKAAEDDRYDESKW